MAGDVFDAGTVYAEARLDRDQYQRDVTALKRDLARLEREARVTIAPKLDDTEIKSGKLQVEQLRKELQELARARVTPKVKPSVDTGELKAGDAQTRLLRQQLESLNRVKATPAVEVRGGAAARAEVERIEDRLRRLSGNRIRVRFSLTGGTTALKQLQGINTATNTMIGLFAKAVLGLMAVQAASVLLVGTLQVLSTAMGGLAVLPAALGSLVGVFAVIKMGVAGVGDALKAAAEGDAAKLEESLKKLAPAAREFVLEVQKVAPAWRDMRLDVQQRLFDGLKWSIASLTDNYLPVMREQLPGIAEELRHIAMQTVAFANGGRQVESVSLVLSNTRGALDALNPAFGYLLQTLFDVAAVGSQLLPDMAGGFTGWARGLSETVERMRDSGQLLEIMQRGLQTLYSLGGAINSIFGIVGGLMRAAGMDGENLAIQLATVLQRTEDWINSVRGQEVLGEFFRVAKDLLVAITPLLGLAAVAAGEFIAKLGPSMPAVADAIKAVLDAAGPLLGLFLDLTAAALPAAAAIVEFAAPFLGPLLGGILAIVGAMKVYHATVTTISAVTKAWAFAQALLNGAMAINPIGLIVVALVALAAGLVLAWQHSETFRNIVIGAWEGIKTAASVAWEFLQGVFTWLSTAAVAVGQTIAAAWQWLVGAAQTVGAAISAAWTATWNAVVAAANWVGGVLAAAWDGVVAAVQAVGQWFTWLWSTVIQPVFDAIGLAARVLFAILFTILVAPLILAVKGLGAVFTWLWEAAIQPAWNAISGFISDVWTGTIQPVLQAIGDFITTVVGAAWTWLRDTVTAVWTGITSAVSAAWNWLLSSVLQPMIDFVVGQLQTSWEFWKAVVVAAWAYIQMAINAAWAFIRDQVFAPIVAFIQGPLTAAWNWARDTAVAVWNAIRDALAAAWNWIKSSVLDPLVAFVTGALVAAWNAAKDGITTAWNAVKDAVVSVWNWIKSNVFDPIVNFVTVDIPNAFQRAVDGIKGAWDKIEGIVRPPVAFVVNVVYNEGIRPAWNYIADIVGLGQLPAKTFATGGMVPGIGDRDTVPALLTPGEYVLSKPAVRAMGGVPMVDRWHQAARKARGVKGLTPEYAMFGGDPSEPGLAYRNKGGPIERFADGGAVARAQAYARSQHGKPYQWAGVGNPSFDCSGFMSAITCVLLGQPVRRLFSTGSFGPGRGAAGFVPGKGTFTIGVRNGNPGHMAGNLAGMPVESGGRGVLAPGGPSVDSFPMQFFLPEVGGVFIGGAGGVDFFAEFKKLWQKVVDAFNKIREFASTTWGSGISGLAKAAAQGILDKLPFGLGSMLGALFDRGGYLPPGLSLVANNTGRPEPVLTPEQWRAITAAPTPATVAGREPGATVDIDKLNATMTEVRELLERRGTGATVNVNQSSGDPVATARAAVLQLRLS